ncbi:glycosidase [Cellulophaga sp. L1A9]|uniref:glycosidase n=1 Tax=Cellulophaga sp. L1A9 TaxID=2686362 RepID=UPI00131CBDAC|nr:glycosidase [Cellulophaga sp. L1A9]
MTDIRNGVMLNAYPDSIGNKLSDTVKVLQMPEFKDVFSLFYVLPTFFNSDLDRGFSIIDYNFNEALVTKEDLKALDALRIMLKFDIVLNHLSVASPQFKDMLQHGKASKYKDFFIDWNQFWEGNGELAENGVIIPDPRHLNKLFMRKSGLPILKVIFPDGTEKPYWNTFYQEIKYQPIAIGDLSNLNVSEKVAVAICETINAAIATQQDFKILDLGTAEIYKDQILAIIEKKRSYLGQMDVNAKSPLVWEFYKETLQKVRSYGCKVLRLDAFAYLHKEVGQTNFFNIPGTWDYLERINKIAQENELQLLPEIHAEYGLHLHDEVAAKGYVIYDFFLPGLTIHALEKGTNTAILKWANEIVAKNYTTVNMLGCHDGIPVLDLKGKEVQGVYQEGLLLDKEIEEIMDTIIARGGRVKNLYDPSGKKISYYQVNATFYSALGESDQKLVLARAIQLFMPGTPQIWYLDLFAGKNNYEAADHGGSGGHKEINRTTLSLEAIHKGLEKPVVLKQLKLLRLRNTNVAFTGKMAIAETAEQELDISWVKGLDSVQLKANLSTYKFEIIITSKDEIEVLHF